MTYINKLFAYPPASSKMFRFFCFVSVVCRSRVTFAEDFSFSRESMRSLIGYYCQCCRFFTFLVIFYFFSSMLGCECVMDGWMDRLFIVGRHRMENPLSQPFFLYNLPSAENRNFLFRSEFKFINGNYGRDEGKSPINCIEHNVHHDWVGMGILIYRSEVNFYSGGAKPNMCELKNV